MSRDSALLLLTSPLGDDTLPFQEGTLHAISMAVQERLSTPFEIDITAVSTRRAIDPNVLLNQPVTLTVRRRDGLDRIFNGIVRQVDAVGFAQRSRWQYRLVAVPLLWFLSQSTDCRIYQQKTAVEILQLLFAENGIEPVDFRIFGSRPKRDYTTQYDETDLQFVHRLLQESGYFYFFKHAYGQHTLVITDANEAFGMLDRPSHRVVHNGNNVDIFDTWCETLQTATGSVRLQDYDPTRPDTPVMGQKATTLPTAGAARRRVFRWPAMTLENQVAADRARFRQQASEAAAALRRGHGFDPALCPGFRFTLWRDPFTGAEGVDHAIHSTRHAATDETWIGGTAAPDYDCEFTCLLQSTPWRDDLSISRPAMCGIYSAIVLAEDGEEIHADALARIKVRPLFDYRKDTVASMAIWVRILNAWAGNRWGWQHLPRVGTEVGLSFMNGDPDNPVVVGQMYNEDMQPVFPVPAMQTRQGFRSRSTRHGGLQEYSELSFDDRRGDELVLLHAQKNHRVEVEHDQTSMIGNDRTVVTTANDSLTSEKGDISITTALGVINITSATAINVTATEAITLRVGTTVVSITEAGINTTTLGETTISALALISLESAGDVNITGTAVTIEAADGEVDCIPFPV